MTLERAFRPCFSACFQNPPIIRVYVVASGFGMLFFRGADIPMHSRLVFDQPPETSNLFYSIQCMYVNGTFCTSLSILFLSTVLLSAGPWVSWKHAPMFNGVFCYIFALRDLRSTFLLRPQKAIESSVLSFFLDPFNSCFRIFIMGTDRSNSFITRFLPSIQV